LFASEALLNCIMENPHDGIATGVW
jgi:hypothetical protein